MEFTLSLHISLSWVCGAPFDLAWNMQFSGPKQLQLQKYFINQFWPLQWWLCNYKWKIIHGQDASQLFDVQIIFSVQGSLSKHEFIRHRNTEIPLECLLAVQRQCHCKLSSNVCVEPSSKFTVMYHHIVHCWHYHCLMYTCSYCRSSRQDCQNVSVCII